MEWEHMDAVGFAGLEIKFQDPETVLLDLDFNLLALKTAKTRSVVVRYGKVTYINASKYWPLSPRPLQGGPTPTVWRFPHTLGRV